MGCNHAERSLWNRCARKDYLEGDEWDCLRKNTTAPAFTLAGERHLWSIRAQAAGGLIWDRRFGPERALTHMWMPAIHLFPPLFAKGQTSKAFVLDINGTHGYGAFIQYYVVKIDACAQDLQHCL